MLKKLSHKLYMRVGAKHPKAMRVYLRYKNHNADFHSANKSVSRKYLLRLIRAEKNKVNLYDVPPPKGAFVPYISNPAAPENANSHMPDANTLTRMPPEELADELCKFDVVSFDVFDTLIFRPFSLPTDLFYLIEAKTECFNFCELRQQAEQKARAKTAKPNFEVDIYDIYDELSKMCWLKKEDAEIEIAFEKEVCYANPYMKRVYDILKDRGQKMIVTSDMYLPTDVIEDILTKNGYDAFEKIFVSNEYGFNKASGKLFGEVKKVYNGDIIHVGDNREADINGAARAKIAAFHYEQANAYGNTLRPKTLMSPVSSVYKGIVNNYMYNGTATDSAREAFGFIYAGPVVVGFCEWLNEFCENKKLDRILFLARDMDVFYKIYNKHYKDFENDYAVTSRFSLQEMIVKDYPAEFFHHTIKARCDRGYTIKQALNEINLDFLCDECKKFKLNEKDVITGVKIGRLENMFSANLDRIADHFADNELAAKQYFKEKIGGAKRICAVDLGWRGSILAYLKFLLVKKWKLCEEVHGVLLGNTVNTTSVNLVSEGIVNSYAYNHLKNRDLLINSNWEIEYIRLLTLESIFTSEEPSLIEYRLDPETKKTVFLYSNENTNAPIVREFQSGIIKFVDMFESFRQKYRDVYPMSPIDAMESILSVAKDYEYVANVIGDVVDTPFAIAGLNVSDLDYVALGELMVERKLINKWPV